MAKHSENGDCAHPVAKHSEDSTPPLLAIFPQELASTACSEATLEERTLPEDDAKAFKMAAMEEALVATSAGCDQEPLATEVRAEQAEQNGEASGSRAVVPPLTLTLTRLPEELPPQLSKDFAIDLSVLGEGAYAAVRRLRHRETGELVALKVVEKHPLLIRNMLPQLQREIGLQGRLPHKHILQLLSCFEDETHVYMLLEYCAGGSLRNLAQLQPNSRFPEGQSAWMFSQILMGVAFMHQQGIVHRDLKHDNILLTANREVRICDFGWSAEVQIERALLTTCGTPHIWAPEIFEGQPQSYATDMWALGNLIYELLVGHQPFWGEMEELRHKILSVDLRYPPDLLSQPAIHMFYCLLQRDPRCRVPAYKLLGEHPFILPALAEMQRQGLVAGRPTPPMANACIECLPADTPVAMGVEPENVSFVPAIQQESMAPQSMEVDPTSEQMPKAEDSSQRLPAKGDVAMPASSLECPSTAPEVERLQDTIDTESDQLATSKETDAVLEVDASPSLAQQDSIVGGA